MPYLQSMCPAELEQAVREEMPLLTAAGSIEYHGSQLPLGTDLLIIEGILKRIEKRIPVVIAPSFVWSPTGYMVSGPEKGTMDIEIDCFINHSAEILAAYDKMGFKQLKVLVHHQGGSIAAFLRTAMMKIGSYRLHRELGHGWWTEQKQPARSCNMEPVPAIFTDSAVRAFGGHGGKGETQAIMALYPELVHLENLTDSEPGWNKSAALADAEEASREMDLLVDAWVARLSKGIGK